MAIYIKGDNVANAETYQLFLKEGSEWTPVKTSKSGINFNVSELGLPAGTYEFAVKAYAVDYEPSNFSNVLSIKLGDDGSVEVPDTPTTYYTITYKCMSGSTTLQTSTETVIAGTTKNFSTANAPSISGFTVSSVSPSGTQIINRDLTVTYTYEVVEVPDEPVIPDKPVTPAWNEVSVVWETGTTSDDEKGTMGNKVNNANRTRSSAAIVGDIVRLESHEDLKIWYNIFDNSGKLITTSGTSLYMPNGTRTVNVRDVGGTQIWPIYKVGDNGSTPLTTEHLNSLKVYTITGLDDLQNVATNLEQGTFADGDGSKQDSAVRVRTAQRVLVPSNATGIFFLPTGTIDLWLKGYSAASGGTINFNGIKGGQYWNTSNSGVLSLTWEQMSVSRPNYIDCVFKAGSGSGTLVPGDLSNVIVAFTY